MEAPSRMTPEVKGIIDKVCTEISRSSIMLLQSSSRSCLLLSGLWRSASIRTMWHSAFSHGGSSF